MFGVQSVLISSPREMTLNERIRCSEGLDLEYLEIYVSIIHSITNFTAMYSHEMKPRFQSLNKYL
jgi:hypothetical protein